MGLIEFNETVNTGAENKSYWSEGTFAILGTVVGFFLSEGATRLRHKRAVRRVGNTFETSIQMFEEPLKKQISNLEKHIESYSNNRKNNPNATFMKALFDLLKSLDKHLLIEYAAKKADSNAQKFVIDKLNAIELVETEIQRFKSTVEENGKKNELLTTEFGKEADRLIRAVFDFYSDNLKRAGVDSYIDALMNILQTLLPSDDSIDELNIFTLEEKVFIPILKLSMLNEQHSISKQTINQAQLAMDCLKQMRLAKEPTLTRFKITVSSLKSCYKTIYEKDYCV
jgi:hypothetical protein